MYVYMYLYICVFMYMCIYQYMYINRFLYMYIYICIYIYVYVYMYICIYVFIYVYVYIYICIYIYILMGLDHQTGTEISLISFGRTLGERDPKGILAASVNRNQRFHWFHGKSARIPWIGGTCHICLAYVSDLCFRENPHNFYGQKYGTNVPSF